MAKKILIIDDEEDFREVLKMRLLYEGYEFLEASDGDEGLEIAQKTRPDLILLDLMMPIFNGYQVWSRLKKSPELSHIPILIVTAKLQATDIFWGQSLPADEFINKTIKLDQLVEKIRKKIDRLEIEPPSLHL